MSWMPRRDEVPSLAQLVLYFIWHLCAITQLVHLFSKLKYPLDIVVVFSVSGIVCTVIDWSRITI